MTIVLGDAVGAVPDGADAVSRRLIAAIHAYVDFLVERPAASIVGITEFRYLVGRDRSRVLEQRDRTEDVFRALVREGASAGEFSVADVGAATRALTTLCNGMSTWYRYDGPLGAPELAGLQADLALGLVRSRYRVVGPAGA